MATKKRKHASEEQFIRDFGQRRLVGCAAKQIAAWLEADEIVDSTFPDDEMSRKVKARLKKVGLGLDVEAMRFYGRRAEDAEHPGKALWWYQELLSRGVGRDLIRLCVERVYIKTALAHLHLFSQEQLQAMGRARLDELAQKKRHDDFYGGFELAVDFFSAILDHRAMRQVFDLAVDRGYEAEARKAAEWLKIPFERSHERRVLAAKVRSMSGLSDDRELLERVQKFGDRSLAWQYIRLLLRDPSYGSSVMKAAAELNVPLSVRQLERLLAATKKHNPDAYIPVAEELAGLDKKWRGRLRGLYAQARDHWLGVGALDRAAKCVDQCGRPFTADELRMIINGYRDDHRPYHLEQAESARRRLMDLVCRQAGVEPPPVKAPMKVSA